VTAALRGPTPIQYTLGVDVPPWPFPRELVSLPRCIHQGVIMSRGPAPLSPGRPDRDSTPRHPCSARGPPPRRAHQAA